LRYLRFGREMARTQRFTTSQIKTALEATRGLASLAARRLGCTHGTVLNYMKRYQEVHDVAERMREAMTDVAELKYWRAIQRGEAWAVTMQLKTQGRERGYGEAPDFQVILHQAVEQLAAEYGVPIEEVMAEAEAIRRSRG
jgi:hypothetical protein